MAGFAPLVRLCLPVGGVWLPTPLVSRRKGRGARSRGEPTDLLTQNEGLVFKVPDWWSFVCLGHTLGLGHSLGVAQTTRCSYALRDLDSIHLENLCFQQEIRRWGKQCLTSSPRIRLRKAEIIPPTS